MSYTLQTTSTQTDFTYTTLVTENHTVVGRHLHDDGHRHGVRFHDDDKHTNQIHDGDYRPTTWWRLHSSRLFYRYGFRRP